MPQAPHVGLSRSYTNAHAGRLRANGLQALVAAMRDDDLRHAMHDCRVRRADSAVMHEGRQAREQVSVIYPAHGNAARQARGKFLLQARRKLALPKRDDGKRSREL